MTNSTVPAPAPALRIFAPARRPAVDRVLQSLPAAISRCMLFETAGTGSVVGCVLGRRLSLDEATSAISALDAACVPAPNARLVDMLSELKAISRTTRQDEGDIGLTLAALATRLRAYPAEIVEEAVKRWGDSEPWFPAWADLKAECDSRSAKLVHARAALRVECVIAEITAVAGDDDEKLKAMAAQRVATERNAGDARHAFRLERIVEEVLRARHAARLGRPRPDPMLRQDGAAGFNL